MGLAGDGVVAREHSNAALTKKSGLSTSLRFCFAFLKVNKRNRDFSPTALDTVLSTPENNRLFIAFHFPGLKEAKNAEAYRAIAAGCVPNDDFIKGG
jgi:replicative superfamily II helicase